ncbi:hypothetical protein GW17_00043052, partial [Ensete ventricosum]
ERRFKMILWLEKEQMLVLTDMGYGERSMCRFINSENELQIATKESDEETQLCASELLALIDAVSEYKEFMESTVSGMKKELSETADFVSSLAAKLVSTVNFSQGGRKRARNPPVN